MKKDKITFEKSAASLRELPIINIANFKRDIAPHISRRIDVSRIKTVEDIYEQRECFYGAMRNVAPGLVMLNNCIYGITFNSWWIVEDENLHHCIIY